MGYSDSTEARGSGIRPFLDRHESHLPPHQRQNVTRIPVTPGFALGTYDHPPGARRGSHQQQKQGYFDAANTHTSTSSSDLFGDEFNASAEGTPGSAKSGLDPDILQAADGKLRLSGRVISATFTIPQTLRYQRDGGNWELNHRLHQSSQLCSLYVLSSNESPWDHTVVGWIGEIPVEAMSTTTTPPEIIPTSTATGLRGQPKSSHPPKSDELHISHEDQTNLERQLLNDRIRTIPVWLADDAQNSETGTRLKNQARWRKFAEHDLCALFHYKQHAPTDRWKEDDRWADYVRMNEAFADKICEEYNPGDVVLIHDYYLMMLPSILRQRHPDMYICLFLHSPFPTSELFRCLRRRKEVLHGVLGSNLIGFQAFHHAQHFASCCTRLLEHPASVEVVDTGRGRAHIGVFPAGIDASMITSLAWTPTVDEKCTALRRLHRGKAIIVGCDTMNRVGGVDKKLVAFERFLDRYSEWKGKVVLLQITSPTAMEDDDGEEAKFASHVNELVSSINSTYGSLDYVPVHTYAQHLSQDEYFALLRCGDTALITSVRDGMSATGLEYVTCQRDAHGPLIISEFSGTASSLEEAIQINPWDSSSVADAINTALTMTAGSRKTMHEALYARVTQEDVGFWIDGLLRRLVHVLGVGGVEEKIPDEDTPATSV